MTDEQWSALLNRIARRVDNYKSNSKSPHTVAADILAFPEIAAGLALYEEREKELDALHAERERLCPTDDVEFFSIPNETLRKRLARSAPE